MIKIIYEQKNYNYEYTGKQAYDIKTEINMNEDAGLDDLLEAFVKIAKTAGYYVSKDNLIEIIKEDIEI